MTLKNYQKKRSFKTTPEPKAKKAVSSISPKNCPVFCVQKHDASHLHYDFRIECKGEMLSWAVPKGPSLDPNQKRLAIHVEDHPLEYRHFEGVIPQGNYGAGTVMIWDEGSYSVPGLSSKKDMENAVWEGMKKGHIEIELYGEKLHGRFVLQRLKKDDDKDWLLIKLKDQEASIEDILIQDRSTRTQRSLSEIAGLKKGPEKKKSLDH